MPAFSRIVKGLAFLLAATAFLLSGPLLSSATAATGQVVKVQTVKVGSPGNDSVSVVPFTDAIYETCADAPSGSSDCLAIGGVDYRYGIGQLEITNQQWVRFLNTVDPSGKNRHRLYAGTQSSSSWPEYGAVDKLPNANGGNHYRVASRPWRRKPYGFATFLSAARFANSLYNGRLLKKESRTRQGFKFVTYKVRLSRNSQRGMYNLAQPSTTRIHKRGFVVPSQDEWVKAAYFDPTRGDLTWTSYWKYPTNAGVFGDGDATAPNPTTLNYRRGDVTSSQNDQPLAAFHASGLPAPNWCPYAALLSGNECSTENPFEIPADAYAEIYQGSLEDVGGAMTRGPWGTLDQGGNAVEWTDTITPPPAGKTGKGRIWRRLHGGISNAPPFQMWPSAVGLQPQDNIFYARTYPWLGIRIGVIGDLKLKN